MSIPVHVLATCRKPELLPYTLLVFDTLRTGFPTAKVTVHSNGLEQYAYKAMSEACSKIGDIEPVVVSERTIHHSWIRQLLNKENEPFFICDTDMCFWDSIEQFTPPPSTPLWGRRVPEFRDESTGYITRSRLHTSLLYFDPMLIREKVSALWPTGEIANFAPFANPVNPIVTMHKGRGIFYDTCAHLFHAIGGTPFMEAQLNCYDHFNSGTIPDLVLPKLVNGAAMEKERAELIANPAKLRGIWRVQDNWFMARQV